MTRFFRRWGALVILAVLWLGSWMAFAYYEARVVQHQADDHGQAYDPQEASDEFWSGTFENLQSEWVQLLVQGGLFVGGARYVFRKQKEDTDRIEAKIDQLLEERR